MDLKGVKNIILDLGGVIINLNQDLTYHSYQKLLPNHFNEIEKELDKQDILNRFETAEVSEADFLSFFKDFNSNISVDDLIDAWNRMLLDIPKERIELIKELSASYNVYLLSNTNPIHLRAINNYVLQHFEIKNLDVLFKKVYYSHEIKFRKPNKAIFEYVLNDSKLKPEDTLFIDDSEEHVLTANQLGIKTHHLNLKENQTLTQLFNEY